MSDKAMESARRTMARLQGDGVGDENVRKLEIGKHAMRVLPRPGHDSWYHEAWTHYFGGEAIRCLTTEWTGKQQNTPSLSTKCPLCLAFRKAVNEANDEHPRGSDKGKAAWKAAKDTYAAALRFYVNQFDPEADEPEVQPFAFGAQIMSGFLTEYIEAGVEFMKIKTGRTMYIKKKQKVGTTDPKNVEYLVIRGKSKTDISDIWEQLERGALLPDLEESTGKEMTAEEMQRVVDSYTVRKPPARKSSQDEEEDDDGKPKKAKKPSCFGDPDTHDPASDACQECAFFKRCKATEEVTEAYDEGRYRDEEDEEESDEEEETPAKKKLKAVKQKLGRVARDEE